MKKWIRTLALGLGIFGIGFGGYRYNNQKNFNKFLTYLRDNVKAQYTWQKNPTFENKKEYDIKFGEYKKFAGELKISKIQDYFRENGILYFKREINDSVYVGKIKEKKLFNGVNVYLTKLNDKNFKGIANLEKVLYGMSSVVPFKDIDGKPAINIELSAIEGFCSNISKNWNVFEKNNNLLKRTYIGWNPRLQAIFKTYKEVPKENIREECIKSEIQEDINHEYQHILDKKTKYSLKDLEKRAMLNSLSKSLAPLWQLEKINSEYRRKNWRHYEDSADEILKELYELLNVKTPREFYSLPKEKITNAAKILLKKDYPD